MMLIYKLLLISLAVIGLFMLIKGIQFLIRYFNNKVVLEIPYSCKTKSFHISKSGPHSIWHKGKLFQKAPAGEWKPVITNELTGERVLLSGSLFRTQVNNGSTARMKLYSFDAQEGNFTLELAAGSSISSLEKAISSIIPGKKADPDHYFVQVREDQPSYLILLGLPLIIVGFLCIIAGIILVATFDQWIHGVQ